MGRLLCVMLLCGVVHGAEPLPVSIDISDALLACKKLAPDKKLKLTLHGEVGAPELVAALAPLSCRPIVVGGAALHAGKVAIEAPDLMTPAEATRLLVAALDSLGLTIEEAGASYRVVDSARGREIASQVTDGERGHGREEFVLRLVRLADAGSEEVAATVGKLRSKEGEVIAVPQSRTLLLIDRAAQVERMEALAHALDRPAVPQRIFVLPTNRQRPSELVDALENIVIGSAPKGDKADPSRPTLLAVDNARVILYSGSELAYRRIEALLDRIDPPIMPGEERGSRFSVFYLKHVVAEDLATVLKEALTAAKPKTAQGAQGATQSYATPGALEGEVRITADKVGNALVVSGSAADLESVRELVARLDLPRRQVYVEAAILDLSADLTRKIGLSLHQAGGNDSVGGLVSSSSTSTANSLTVSTTGIASALSGGLLAGVLGKSFDFAGTSIPSFGVVLQALESSSEVSVLSRPHLLMLDHVKSTISVGQKIPFPIQSLSAATTGTTTAALATTYSREDVALKFDLTPHLSDEHEISLEIDGEISDVASTAASSGGGPTTNKRAIKTTVVVHDGETVVLGGLQKENSTDQVDKIPLLGDLPILGRLFQTKSKQRTKQDLLIVITPYVIRDASDLRRIYDRRETERRELIERTTAFSDPSVYDPHVDYHRKRGLLEEINCAARAIEDESEALANARAALGTRRAIEGGEVRVDDPPQLREDRRHDRVE